MLYDPVLLNLPDLETPGLIQKPPCGSLDTVTGAVCTQPEHSSNDHCDDSDWRFIFKWRDIPDLSLIVPSGYDGVDE